MTTDSWNGPVVQAQERLIKAICEAGNHAFLPSTVAIPLREFVRELEKSLTTEAKP